MRVQLWSYNYDPEPSGIGPVSTTLAKGLQQRGHSVSVVAAHPHYPSAEWGTRILPYREVRDGIPVLRLPLWIGRATVAQRLRQELTFLVSQFVAAPFLGRPDVAIVVSPSFPALLPAIVTHRAKRTPWVLWIHDLLPDGATSTGLVQEGGRVLRLSRRLERSAYSNADRIVVLSRAFATNLLTKDVPAEKLDLIYTPATRRPTQLDDDSHTISLRPLRLLSMGNIGHSQGLAPLVEAFEASSEMRSGEVELVITGVGVAADDVRAKIHSDRVQMLGMVSDDELERQLRRGSVALVTQQHQGAEFNIPSKLMNFMAYGLPVLAAVNRDSEVAHLVRQAAAGWIVDSSNPAALPAQVARLMERPEEIAQHAAAARRFAARRFSIESFVDQFEITLHKAVNGRMAAQPRSLA